ncbi:MAG: hypothetical protein KBG83_07700 [Bacteroidetes bacterium]|nr:hypothetical protein [Bacteroidota bacterium]
MSDFLQQHIEILERRLKESSASPLFAQLAAYYLESGKAEDAVRICDAGLARYPFYSTGHLVKGKALIALQMLKEARRELEFVADFFSKNNEILRLLSSVPLSEDELPVSYMPQQEAQSITVNPGEEISIPESEPTSNFQQTIEHAPAGWGDILEDIQPAENQTQQYKPLLHDEYSLPLAAEPSVAGLGIQEPPVTPSFDFQIPETQQNTWNSPQALPTFEFTPPPSPPAAIPPKPISPDEIASFDVYVTRMRSELTGEDSISLDGFFQKQTTEEIPATFNPPSFGLSESPSEDTFSFPGTTSPLIDSFGATQEEPFAFNPPFASDLPSGEENTIEDLAKKLQGAGRIAPIIDFTQKETPTFSEQDTDIGNDFVTPTLAEIYARQGWYDDAIKAYKTLSRTKPEERENYEKRIQELEELKKQAPSQQ